MSPVRIKMTKAGVPKKLNSIAAQPSPLDSMTPRQRSDMDTMLVGGASTTQVIDHFQKEEGLWVGMKDNSIRKVINRYRKNELTKSVVASVLGGQVGGANAIEKLIKNIDTMGEMEIMLDMQKARVLKMYEKEKEGPLLMEVVSRELMNWNVMTERLARLQLESGIIRRAPRTVQGQMMDEKGNVRSFSWTEEQAELFKTLEGVTYAEKSA